MVKRVRDTLRTLHSSGMCQIKSPHLAQVGHVTVLDQWGGVVWDNRLSSAGLLAGQW